jgi:tetratricopeptide (TPR) repeat protein
MAKRPQLVSVEKPPAPPPPRPAGGRRLRWALAACGLAAVVVLGALGWRLGRREEPPAPPAISVEGLDKDIADAIQREYAAVRGPEARSGKAWGRLAMLLLAHGFDEQAGECFLHAERFDPDEPRWPYLRGANLLTEHGREEGLQLLRRAVALADRAEPDNVALRLALAEHLLALGYADEAEAELDRAAHKKKGDPRLRFDRGLLAIYRGQTRRAVELLTPLTDHSVVGGRVCSQLAALHARLGDAGRAREYARRADESTSYYQWPDPYRAEYAGRRVGRLARFRQAARHKDYHQYALAVKQLSRLVDAGEKDFDLAYYALGGSQMALGDLDAAEQTFRQALRLEPERAQTIIYLGQVLFLQAMRLQRQKGDGPAAARAKYKESAELMQRSVRLKPNDAEANQCLGRALLALGRPREAAGALQVVCDVRPEKMVGHLYLGEALLADGQLARARACLQQAADLAGKSDSRPRQALKRLGEAEKQAGVKRGSAAPAGKY